MTILAIALYAFPGNWLESASAERSRSSTISVVSGSGQINATAGSTARIYAVCDIADPSNTAGVVCYAFDGGQYSNYTMGKSQVSGSRYNFTYNITLAVDENRNISYSVKIGDATSLVNYSYQMDTLLDTDGFTTAQDGNSPDASPFRILNIAGNSDLAYIDSQSSGNAGQYNVGEPIRRSGKNFDSVLGSATSTPIWVNYTSSNKIASDSIKAIEKDGSDIWFATSSSGLSRYNNITGVWTTYTTSNNLPSNQVRGIAADGYNIWIATAGGPAVYNKTTGQITKWASSSLPQSGLFVGAITDYKAVAVDQSTSIVWFGTNEGLVGCIKASMTWIDANTFDYGIVASYDNINTIMVYDGYVWTGTNGGGIVQWPSGPGAGGAQKYYWDTGGNFINSMKSEGGYIWVSTTYGAYRIYMIYNPGESPTAIRTSTPTLSGSSAPLYSAAVDGDNVWFGGTSLYRLNRTHNPSGAQISDHLQTLSSTSSGLLPGNITALLDDGDFLWAGTETGLCRYNTARGTWDNFTQNMSIPSNNIQNIIYGDGAVWISTDSGASVFYLQGEGSHSSAWRRFTTSNGLANNNVYSIAIDGGDVWFGTYGYGITRHNTTTNSWTTYAAAGGTSAAANWIQTIAVDDNSVWFGTISGTTSGGIRRYIKSNNTWANYTQTNCSILSGGVAAIQPVEDGIWFGSGTLLGQFFTANGTWASAGSSDVEYVTGGPVITSGSVVGGSYADTMASNSVVHSIRESSGGSKVLDFYYSLNTSLQKTQISDIELKIGAWYDNTDYGQDSPAVYIWNFTSSSWAQTAITVSATSSGTIYSDSATPMTDHISQTGEMRIRFKDSASTGWESTGTLAVDYLFVNLTYGGISGVRAAAKDSTTIWFGSAGGAASYDLSSGNWTYYTTASGLGSNSVYGIAIDGGNVWFGTAAGATCYSKDMGAFINYTTGDGLLSNTVRAIAVNDGAVFFATSSGVTRLYTGMQFGSSDRIYFNDANADSAWESGEDIWYDSDGNGQINENAPFRLNVLSIPNSGPALPIFNVSTANMTFRTNKTIAFLGYAADSDGYIVNYTWDFGDGYTWNGTSNANTSYNYSSPGAYTPTLWAFDDRGGFATNSAPITVTANAAPSVNITLPPEILANTSMRFYSAASDSDGNITAYYWEFGDAGTSADWAPYHTYTQKGNFTINLTVTDNEGAYANASKTIQITNRKPALNLTIPQNISVGANRQYQCAASDADGTIASYLWDFGDNQTSTAQNPQHTYLALGNYIIRVVATDNDGESAYQNVSISITNVAPPVEIGGPANNSVFSKNTPVIFNTSAANMTYLWDFGDVYDSANNTATTQSAVHTYRRVGTYSAALTITAASGAQNTTLITVNITNRLPRPMLAPNATTTMLNWTVRLDGSYSLDDGSIVAYRWNIDGTSTGWLAQSYYDTRFTTTGNHIVILWVKDDDGGENQTTPPAIIDVRSGTPLPPTASMTYAPLTGATAGVELTFNASGSLSNGGYITSYRWSFGDGDYQNWSANYVATHTFNRCGNYTITLYVRDSLGQSNSRNEIVEIKNVAPAAAFSALRQSANTGEAITFDAAASSDADSGISMYIWNFKDGNIINTTDKTITHSFGTAGFYRVNLTVVDANGTVSYYEPASDLWILPQEKSGWSLDDPNVIGLIVSGVGAAAGYAAYTMRKRKLGKDLKAITDAYMRYRNKPEYCEEALNNLRQKFSDDFESGKLDGNNYLIIEKRIDNYIKELRTNRVESQMSSVPLQIRKSIEGILADGKITQEEYDGLMKQVVASNIGESDRRNIEDMFSKWMHTDAQRSPAHTSAESTPKTVQRVRCSKCGALININTTKRPLTIFCPKCGMKGVLKAKDGQDGDGASQHAVKLPPRAQPAPAEAAQQPFCPSCQINVPMHLLLDGDKCPYCGEYVLVRKP